MTEYIHLIGAEDVQKAGYTMRDAAENMNRAATNMQYAFEQHQRFLDDWLQRAQILMERPITLKIKGREVGDEQGKA